MNIFRNSELNPGDRRNLKTEVDFKNLFKAYEQTIPAKTRAMPWKKSEAWLRSGESVALTCFELEAGQCHRHCVANALEKTTDQDRSCRSRRSTLPLSCDGAKHL